MLHPDICVDQRNEANWNRIQRCWNSACCFDLKSCFMKPVLLTNDCFYYWFIQSIIYYLWNFDLRTWEVMNNSHHSSVWAWGGIFPTAHFVKLMLLFHMLALTLLDPTLFWNWYWYFIYFTCHCRLTSLLVAGFLTKLEREAESKSQMFLRHKEGRNFMFNRS